MSDKDFSTRVVSVDLEIQLLSQDLECIIGIGQSETQLCVNHGNWRYYVIRYIVKLWRKG